MCGRFTLTADFSALEDVFPGLAAPDPPVLRPRYNVAPTQPVAVVQNDDRKQIEMARWGLVPSWARDVSVGARMINARAETLGEKSAFRDAIVHRRCLVLATGFYEWQTRPGQRRKTPMYLRLRSGRPFAFAGLWDTWRRRAGEPLLSCTIITTSPNELVAPIHDRMPVILRPADVERWLESRPGTGDWRTVFAPYAADEMEAYPVSTRVNDVDIDDAALLDHSEPPPEPQYDLFD